MAGIYGPGGIVVGADRPIGVYPITRGSGGGVLRLDFSRASASQYLLLIF